MGIGWLDGVYWGKMGMLGVKRVVVLIAGDNFSGTNKSTFTGSRRVVPAVLA